MAIDRSGESYPPRERLNGRESSFNLDQLGTGRTTDSNTGAVRALWRTNLECETDRGLCYILAVAAEI